MFHVLQILVDSLRSMLMLPDAVKTLPPAMPSAKLVPDVVTREIRTMDEFLQEIKVLFEGPLRHTNLLEMSTLLQEQYKQRLQSSSSCMLPSYNTTLPTGNERGKYLALDVGGTNFRVAMVDLSGQINGSDSMTIVKMRTFLIDKCVRALKGHAFFDWMAERIQELLQDTDVQEAHSGETLGMGLAWSFPVEQTSLSSGILLEMGKGFNASVGVLGQDIGELLLQACKRKGLNVRMDAIINDSTATLLSRAYRDSNTCMALILGTGFNAAVMLPVTALAQEKLGTRPQSWHEKAKHVLVNTELSMFGRGILPSTRWDDYLNSTHMHPDYQPFEYFISGRYLGEIARLVLVEAIQIAGLFGGQLPAGFEEPYSLEAGTLAVLESDDTPNFSKATVILERLHPLSSTPSPQDLRYAQQICKLVSHRAAAYLATGIHALWMLQCSSEGIHLSDAPRVTIGCNGSIIERYPQFRVLCQGYLDELTSLSGAPTHSVVLELAYESAIFGAAVAVCCAGDQATP